MWKALPKKALGLSLAALLPGINYAVSAPLEEVIVTAQKRAESLQDVPVSINVVSGEMLKGANITKIEDLQAYVPNLNMSETGIGTNIYIRGIGSGINQGFEQSVGMYVDGVYYGRAQLSRAPFLDIERVEVLRGPQNILYGKNSIAGAMSIVTAAPEDTFGGSISATIEPVQGEQIVDAMVTGPITDNLRYRIAHRTRTTDGYIENIDLGDEPQRDESTTRLTLAWQPNQHADVKLKYEQGTFDVTGRQVEIVTDLPSLNPNIAPANWSQLLTAIGQGRVGPSVLDTTQDGRRSSNGDFSQNDTENVTLNVNYRFNGYELVSTTSSVKYDYNELCDCDFTSADIFFVESQEDFEQFSQEFRIVSPGGQTVDWIAGVYYQEADLTFNDAFYTTPTSLIGDIMDTVLPSSPLGSAYPVGTAQILNNFSVPRAYQQDSELLSAFIQVTWNMSDALRLTVGGRQSNETKTASRRLDFHGSNDTPLPYDESFLPAGYMGVDYLLGRILNVSRHDLNGKREEDIFAPAANIEFDFNDDMMGYVSWASGVKAGGFDVRSNSTINPPLITNPFSSALTFSVPPGSFEFEDEQSETVEIGLKTKLADGAAELNIAAFVTEYEDLQVSIYDGVLGFNVGNAAKATTQGVEIDGRWAMTDELTFSGAMAWLDFEFKDYDNGQCTQLVRIQRAAVGNSDTNCSYNGLTNQYVADFSGTLTLDYLTDITSNLVFNAVFDAIFTSDYNPSQNLDPLIEQNGFTKLNLRASISDKDRQWEVAVIGKNLSDEQVITYANDTPLSTNLSQSIGHYAFVEPGRTIALQATYNF